MNSFLSLIAILFWLFVGIFVLASVGTTIYYFFKKKAGTGLTEKNESNSYSLDQQKEKR